MKRLLPLCLLGLLLTAFCFGPALVLPAHGISDFLGLYTGGRLVGKPNLYSPSQMFAAQSARAGYFNTNRPFIRPPYYAALMWPLSRLAYLPAFYLWQTLLLAASIGFARLWPVGRRRSTILACCWSFPLLSAWFEGQDIAFVLLAIALAVVQMRAGHPWVAGLLFSACAAKFHIFLLVPLWIIAQKRWRFGLGFATGAAALIAVSFAAGGLGWPHGYLALLSDPATNPNADVMPNLHGMFYAMAGSARLELAGTLVIAALAFWAFRRLSFEYGLALTTAGGILISRHCYVPDCALLLPGILSMLALGKTSLERRAALVLLAPPVYWGMIGGPAMMLATRAAMVAYVLLLAWVAYFSTGKPESL